LSHPVDKIPLAREATQSAFLQLADGRFPSWQGFVPAIHPRELERWEQDRNFRLNGSRMIKIDSGVRIILLEMTFAW
jgi:hypothetical protein